MDMQVDQAWRDIEPAHVNGFYGIARIEARAHASDMSILYGNIHDRIDMVFGIDDMATPQQ
jgi:hypothetical protein